MPKLKKRFWLISLTVFAVLIMLVLATQLGDPTVAQVSPLPQTAQIDPALRSLVVVQPGDQRPVLKPGFIQVDLVDGAVPALLSTGIVRTDVDCAADQAGVSHCRNLIEVGASQVEVRHHHKMAEEPCFSPTEAVNIMSVASYAALQTSNP
jgi:hypothetical protein